jgi:hypothetical protein
MTTKCILGHYANVSSLGTGKTPIKKEGYKMLTELLKAVEMKKTSLEEELENQTGKKLREGESAESAAEIEARLAAINEKSLKEYQAMWLSFTPPGPFPCPFCYLYERKVSPLKPLPRMEDVEPVRCSECGETFEIPVELF